MKKNDELEKKSTFIGALCMLILVFVMYTFEIVKLGKANYGLFGIISIFNGSTNLYKAIKTKDKIYIMSAVVWMLLTIICMYSYFDDLFKVIK